MRLVTDNTYELIGNLLILLGYGLFLVALYHSADAILDVVLDPLGMLENNDKPEVKKVKKEPKNLFETDKVFWDMVIAGSFLLWFIMVVGAITVVAL